MIPCTTTPSSTSLATFLKAIPILPRRLWLDTPGVRATVPMLRGTWGAALHDLAPEAYRAVFGNDDEGQKHGAASRVRPGDRQGQKQNRANGGRMVHTPPGYLIRPAPPDPRFAPAVDFFLIGDALRHEAACTAAWLEAARRGLGKERRPFQIRGTFVLGPSGTICEEQGLRDWGLGVREVPSPELRIPHSEFPTPNPQPRLPQSPAWPLSQAVWPLEPGAPCRLVFTAPLRLRRHGRLIEQPALADLVVAACRRIEAFLPADLSDEWRACSGAALDRAKCLPVSAWTGERLDLHRWSARQQNELDLHGVAGSLELPDGAGELAPLLAAARWLHIGKGTVMGLGQFEVEGLRF